MKTIKGKKSFLLLGMFFLLWGMPQSASAHCDSYDGLVIKDALRALKNNTVELVLKWIEEEHEPEIRSLFSKTAALRTADKEIYQIVEKHFLETLVRLHREGEGAPFTGLKPAGSTSQIIVLADHALEKEDIDGLATKLNAHIEKVVREKYRKVAELNKVKDTSPEKGRA